jgi:hypothetical protein
LRKRIKRIGENAAGGEREGGVQDHSRRREKEEKMNRRVKI